MKRLHIALIIIPLLFGGCARLIYGLHKNKPLKTEAIVRYSERLKIPATDSYELDTAYLRFIRSADTVKQAVAVKNHYQPLQVLYYNQEGALQVFLVNCYVGGIPNLKWNRGGSLESFLPKQQAPLDSLLPLTTHIRYLKPLPGAHDISFEKAEYTVIVYWSRFMGRQSGRLIRAVRRNVALAGNKRVRVLYVNTDNFFSNMP